MRISATFFSCSIEEAFRFALPVSNSSRSKVNQVVLSTGLPASSMNAISFLSTPNSGTFSSNPDGSLTERNLPSRSSRLPAPAAAFSPSSPAAFPACSTEVVTGGGTLQVLSM